MRTALSFPLTLPIVSTPSDYNSRTRARITSDDARWFWDKYPSASLSTLCTMLIQDFRLFVDDREGSLEEHIQEFHERIHL